MSYRIKSVLALIVILGLTLLAIASAKGQAAAAPLAVRLRVAHLAPFAASGEDATLSVEINGTPLPTDLDYGDHLDYQSLAAGPGDYQIQVSLDGGVIISKTVTLADGDNSLAIIGDMNNTPADVWALSDTVAPPGAGRTVLRVAHAAPIGATIDETRVDVCTQDGVPFDNSANNLRYRQASSFKSIPAATYDLKITRAVESAPCSGDIVIDPPEIELANGAITTLYLIGDGTNRPMAVFTFQEGIIGEPEPTNGTIFVPAILR